MPLSEDGDPGVNSKPTAQCLRKSAPLQLTHFPPSLVPPQECPSWVPLSPLRFFSAFLPPTLMPRRPCTSCSYILLIFHLRSLWGAPYNQCFNIQLSPQSW